MAPLPLPSASRSRPAISLVHPAPCSASSVDACLVPAPLSPSSAREQFSANDAQPGRPASWIGNPKEYSQKVVSSLSLGMGISNGKEQNVEEPFYKCTLCFLPLPPHSKPYTLPGTCSRSAAMKSEGTGRIFCEECWIWIYDLSICWACGEVVGRSEERVGFGWCWWHWGCLGCLICKAPIKPPLWSGDSKGIDLIEPPICAHCVGDCDNTEQPSQKATRRKSDSPKADPHMGDLNVTASEVLHRMRRINHVEECNLVFKHNHPRSKKRSRSESRLDNKSSDWKSTKITKADEAMDQRKVSDSTIKLSRYFQSGNSSDSKPTFVSVFQPLELGESFQPSKPRALPKWMTQLPSSRVKDSLMRRPSAPVRLPSQLKPLELLDSRSQVPPTNHLLSERSSPRTVSSVSPGTAYAANGTDFRAHRAQSYPEQQIMPQKQVSAFPFFQNPRAPLTPAVESSWGTTASPGMTPYTGLYPIKEKKSSPKSGLSEVLQSTEYNDKYGVQISEPETPNKRICPICEEQIETSEHGNDGYRRASKKNQIPEICTGPHGHMYHIGCVQCRACRQAFRSNDSMTEWTWVGSSSPYHRTCMVQGAKPMLERLRKRLSMSGMASKYHGRPDAGGQMLPGLTRSTADFLQQKKANHDFITTMKKPEYMRGLPSLFSTRVGPEPCASCGHALLLTESVVGPANTKHHLACLSACMQCGRDFKGNGTKWYTYGRRGLMKGLCEKCWIDKNGTV